MSAWLLALAAGLLLAALSYVGRSAPALAQRFVLGAARAAAVALLAALALDAPAGPSRTPPPLVAIDVSASWRRGDDGASFTRALREARARASDTLFAVGDSLRAAPSDVDARDLASRVASLADRASASGRALVLFTDGEIDDAPALRAAPRGSRIQGVPPHRGPDAAALTLDAPRAAAAGDTIDVRVTIGADASGAGAGAVVVDAGGRGRTRTAIDAMPAFGERTITTRLPLAGLDGSVTLRAVVESTGDREPRNDTVSTTLDVSAAPAAVFVSTAPDYDARGMLGVLRGALSLPTRAFLRIAPGVWRVEGTLAPVAEADVRSAVRVAGLLVLHGDTSLFGAPRGVGRGALLLVPSTTVAGGTSASAEWFASDAPPSPAAAALSGVAWDSLPPLDVTGAPPAGDFEVLRARLGRGGTPRVVIAGSERGRRVVVVGATGFWRWQFRGGAVADAFTGLWGGVFDFLAAGRGEVRAAVVADAVVRAGEPVRWRRGGADSLVSAVVSRRGAPSSVDTVPIQFGPRGDAVATAPLASGVYDVRVPGGASTLVVNVARELLPRRPSAAPGPIGDGPAADATPRVRDMSWLYALALALLCAEWLLRRRWGLR